MPSLIAELTAAGAVLTDGAWGTELAARGLAPEEVPDTWNLSHPERVEAVARAYVDAGSRVILTNTFRANRIALPHPDSAAINQAGVEISRRAAADRAVVFASIGPSGKLLLTGEITEAELIKAFLQQALALAAAGAHGIVVETMSDLAEARCALTAARETGLPVAACMVFHSGKNRDRTMMGVTPEQAGQELAAAGASVVGANCGLGFDGYVDLCRRLRQASGLPVWAKPNAGLPELVEGAPIYKITPQQFAAWLSLLAASGAAFVGGCCGSSPRHIEAARRKLDNLCA